MALFRLALARRSTQSLVSSRRVPLKLSTYTRGLQTSSSESSFRGSVGSHLAAAGLGAASVLTGVYVYYHFSGLKVVVDKARAAKSKYDHVHTAWSETKPRTPSEAVAFLRRISRSGSSPVPDAFVDMVAQFQGSHAEDIDRIVFGAVDDIQAIIAESRAATAVDGVETVSEEGLTVQDRTRIASVVQERSRELREYMREKARGPEDGKSRFKVMTRFRTRHGDNQPIAEEDSSK